MENAEDGRAEHHINQYIIKDEIGRGSSGAVHLAVDQYGIEYAVKEFSKTRLRKRAQWKMLRRPHSKRPVDLTLQSSALDETVAPLDLIRQEVAILKKLNHPNLVTLFEVLDDPEEDSIYMVMELCKKGVIMKVGLGERADPYDSETCRVWFRDLILGVEYLRGQGIIHRDIKPDNLLLTEDDVLKMVDFGFSAMFEKESDIIMERHAPMPAGASAFLPPELCGTMRSGVSSTAADIWSMGVSLYCLRFGRLPFERPGILELYEAIKSDDLAIDQRMEPEFIDLIQKILEKDPEKRIKMAEIRTHPWVTKSGTDPLLSAEENLEDLLGPPAPSEVNHAITPKMRNLLSTMKAVQKFKGLLDRRSPP